MMNETFVLFAKRAFSYVMEGVDSKDVSFAPFACSNPLPST